MLHTNILVRAKHEPDVLSFEDEMPVVGESEVSVPFLLSM